MVDRDSILTEVWKTERLAQFAAVGMRVGAHPPRSGGRQGFEFGNQRTVRIEELRWSITAHPLLDNPQMLWIGLHVQHRHLVGSPGACHLVAVDLSWSSPALGCAEDDHRPAGPLRLRGLPGHLLDGSNLLHAPLDRR